VREHLGGIPCHARQKHSYEEEDTCMSYEEEDTCDARQKHSYEEEDTCMSYEEEDTCDARQIGRAVQGHFGHSLGK
jgi:hypothetical protein